MKPLKNETHETPGHSGTGPVEDPSLLPDNETPSSCFDLLHMWQLALSSEPAPESIQRMWTRIRKELLVEHTK